MVKKKKKKEFVKKGGVLLLFFTFSVCRSDAPHPELWYLQGKRTVEATFSMARFRMFPPS